jgi:hypothetical protein
VEEFIGEPHVFTVDIYDKQALKDAIQKAVQAIDSGKVCTVSFLLYHQLFWRVLQYVWLYTGMRQLKIRNVMVAGRTTIFKNTVKGYHLSKHGHTALVIVKWLSCMLGLTVNRSKEGSFG